jgi:Zn ribbon nucleic-acid-binding protein
MAPVFPQQPPEIYLCPNCEALYAVVYTEHPITLTYITECIACGKKQKWSSKFAPKYKLIRDKSNA